MSGAVLAELYSLLETDTEVFDDNYFSQRFGDVKILNKKLKLAIPMLKAKDSFRLLAVRDSQLQECLH